MKFSFRSTFLASLWVCTCMWFAAGWFAADTVQAQSGPTPGYGSARQYYSPYKYVPSHGYGYRIYYFKPSPTYAGYKHHYVIYPKHDPHHGYYYNPEKQSFWGRCPTHCHGKPVYSLLQPAYRKSSLAAIPWNAFPKPGHCPSIPGATDNTVLDLAPDDTPITPAAGAGGAVTGGAAPAGGAPAGGSPTGGAPAGGAPAGGAPAGGAPAGGAPAGGAPAGGAPAAGAGAGGQPPAGGAPNQAAAPPATGAPPADAPPAAAVVAPSAPGSP